MTGGGTAGHVTPNLALIPKLKENGFEKDTELLQVVRYHHSKNLIKDNKILNIIKVCDDKN